MALTVDDIQSIIAAGIELGLADGQRRAALLAGLPKPLIAELPEHQTPSAQLISDVNALAHRPAYPSTHGPTLPLRAWLANALLICGERPAAAVLTDARSRLTDISGPPLDELSGCLTTPPARKPKLPRDAISRLLIARNEVVPFIGREAILADLDRWADEDPANVALRVIYGPGGAGKTRLLIEWLRRRPTDVPAGFLTGPIADETIDAVERAHAVTLVVDYAETRRGLFELLQRLGARWSADTPGRIRLVLLARNVDDWWASLRQRDRGIEDLVQDCPQAAWRLPALVDEDARADEFLRAARAFAKRRKTAPPTAAPDLSDPRFGRALYLHVAALAAVDGLPLSADTLLVDLLGHESRMWLARAGIDPADADAADGFITDARALLGAATLRGGIGDKRAALALAERVCPDGAPPDTLVKTLRTIYGAAQGWVAPLEPDLLGEALVDGLLESPACPGWLEQSMAGATAPEAESAFTVLGRLELRGSTRVERAFGRLLADDFDVRAEGAFAALLALTEETAHSRLGQVLAGALETRGTEALARRFDGQVPWETTMLREVGLWVEEALLDSAEGDAARAGRLINTGYRLVQLGRREAALAATEEAVALRRQLADTRPDDFRPDLATSLNNLGNMLAEVGRREAALAANEEAVALRRQLADARPDAFLPDLAMTLNNLGKMLSALGRREAALAATEEALALFRPLADARPDASLPHLAASLNNLGVMLSALGRREAALAATEEAVAIRRQLAAARPDAFLPDLAMSLVNLGLRLADERPAEAAAAMDEGFAAIWPLFERWPAALTVQVEWMLNARSALAEQVPSATLAERRDRYTALTAEADPPPD